MDMRDLEEYKVLGEPGKAEKSENWQAAIGLQQVDGLKPSEYLIKTAIANIEGDITFDEVNSRLNAYYQENSVGTFDDERTEEADKVSARIAEILSEKAFHFSPAEFIGIHGRLFAGVFTHAGTVRTVNITKDEWVLENETVLYAGANMIMAALKHDFENEKSFNYLGLNKQKTMEHISKFVSDIWQIHPFREGNTRTTAVFIIKYLRKLGFKVDNEQFAKHSWYFRNALVRANYTDLGKGVGASARFLHSFFENLLLGETNELKNRYIHIRWNGKNGTINEENAPVNDGNAPVNGKNAPVNAPVKFTKTQAKILEMLREDNTLTREFLCARLQKDIGTIKRAIKALREKGVLERKGSDKTGYWEVKNHP